VSTVIPVRTLNRSWTTNTGKNGGSESNLLPLDVRTAEVISALKENKP
jgi:hypothetical protein